jgi:hypothetical protein
VTSRAHDRPSMAGLHHCSVSARHLIPHKQRASPQQTVVSSPQEVTSDPKEVEHKPVHRQESLRVFGGLESSHLSLALSGRLMGHFRSVVLVLRGAVNNRGQDRAVGGRIAAELVRDQSLRDTPLPFQELPEEALGRMPISPGLDEDVDRITVLVDGSPEILLSPLDVDEQFVQVPGVAQPSTLASKPTSVIRTEGVTPLPDGLVGDGDAPLGEEIFSIPEAQTETVVEPDGVTDDHRRKSVAVVIGRLAVHRPTLSATAST